MEFNKVKLDRLDRLFLLSYHHKNDQKNKLNVQDSPDPVTRKEGLEETAKCTNGNIKCATKNKVPKNQVTPMETLKNVGARRGSGTAITFGSERIGKCTQNMNVKPIKMFIDLPTIDYYNDELAHNKIMKFNKKLKVHTLRDFILSEFQIPELKLPSKNVNQEKTTRDDEYASLPAKDRKSFDDKIFYDITIKSSGSLRYVGTIKYIIEECFSKLSENRCRFHIQVTQTSLKWFNTYLNKDILGLSSKFIEYKVINNNLIYSDGHSDVALTPFKEYYKELSRLFTSKILPKTNTNESWQTQSENGTWDECIIVVTNNTGIKALLTILSDRPLTKFLTENSLNALSSDPNSEFGMSSKHLERSSTPPLAAGNVSWVPHFPNNFTPGQTTKSGTVTKRNVPTNFDNITSYKDKSVKVLSSENLAKLIKPRSSNLSTPLEKKVLLKNTRKKIHHTDELNLSDVLNAEQNDKDANYNNDNNDNNNAHEDEEEEEKDQKTNDEEDGDEDEDDEDDDSCSDNSSSSSDSDDSGLTLNVPTYSQRMSLFDFNPRTSGRARSISLMGPAQQAPFLTKTQLDSENQTIIQKSAGETHTQWVDEIRDFKAKAQTTEFYDDRLTEENLEDEMCSAKKNFQNSHYQNIYVHDGEATDDSNDIDEVLFNVAQDGNNLSRKSSTDSFATLPGSVRVSRAKNLKNSNNKLNRFRTRSRSRSKHRSLSLSQSKTNNSSANSLIPPEFYSKISAASPIPVRSSSELTTQENSELSLKQSRPPDGETESAGTSDETVNSSTKANPVDLNLLSRGDFGKYLTTGNKDLLIVRKEQSPQRKMSFDYEDAQANDHYALMFGSSNAKSGIKRDHPDNGGQELEISNKLDGNNHEKAINMPFDKNITLPRTFTGLIDLKNLNLYSQTAQLESEVCNGGPAANTDVLDVEDLLMCGTESVKPGLNDDHACFSLETSSSNQNEKQEPKIVCAKPAFTLDLYGDGETDSNAWVFGANR